jgi:hypothetical protein
MILASCHLVDDDEEDDDQDDVEHFQVDNSGSPTFATTTTTTNQTNSYSTTAPSSSANTKNIPCFSIPNSQSLRGLPLENATFHVVHIATGAIAYRCRFRRDFIQLVQHSGVYIYKDLFAVLSIQNQLIHLFRIRVCC